MNATNAFEQDGLPSGVAGQRLFKMQHARLLCAGHRGQMMPCTSGKLLILTEPREDTGREFGGLVARRESKAFVWSVCVHMA